MGWLLGLEQSEANSRGQFRCAALSSIFVLLAAQFVPSTAYPQADSRCSAIVERSDDGSVIRVCEVLFQRLWSQDAEKLTGELRPDHRIRCLSRGDALSLCLKGHVSVFRWKRRGLVEAASLGERAL